MLMKYCYGMMYLLLLIMAGCSKTRDAEDSIDKVESPKIVSSTIENGAENVSDGQQTLRITFDQNITLPSPGNIRLNGTSVQGVSAAFKELHIPVVLLRSTAYTLVIPGNTIKGPTGLFAEGLEISFTTIGAVGETVKTHLVTENPSAEVQNVYGFLRENYGVKLISGVMANVNWNSNEAEWVYKHTGKYPVLNCFDYVHLYASPANWINYEQIQVVEDWWQNKGLVSAMWHWNVPVNEGSTSYQFYTRETTFDVARAVIEGTYEHTVIKADLNRIADHLLLLKAKHIPVIWRPLHEAAGTWFWWGAKGSEPYKKLWVIMFEVFKSKGLNNLIWVWTSETNDDAWYPGDAYVDIIGIDLYDKASAADIASIYTTLTRKYTDKMIALSEFGNVAGFSSQWTDGARWSWAMPWYDYERTVSTTGTAFNEKSHQHANISYWEDLLNNPVVLTRDEMPDLK